MNRRHADWHDDRRLWLATVAVNPRSCGAQSAVGGGLLSRGMATGDPELLRASAAREELALRLCSDDSDPFRAAFAYTRLGAARALLDDRAAARVALERATVLHPRYALPFAWLGYLAYQEGDQGGRRDVVEEGDHRSRDRPTRRWPPSRVFTWTKSDRVGRRSGAVDSLARFS